MADVKQMTVPMSRLAYLTYSDMIQKIQDKEIDEYDIVYSKDRLITYLISEELEPIEMRSRVYVFNDEETAIVQLNQNTDTYIGQIVAILYNGIYRGYIVNEKDGKFIVTPLWEHSEPIDYNTLGNRPIESLIGTFGNTIIVSELDTGIYSIRGQYKITEDDKTLNISSNDVIFIVNKEDNSIMIKKITSENIIDYLVSDRTITSNKYITSDYLSQNNYTTTDYVDIKIEALNKSITEDMQNYVKKIVEEQFGTILDDKIESKIGEMYIPIDDSEINNLFI